MGIEDNKAIFRRYVQLLTKPEQLDEIVSADFVGHDLAPGLSPGIEGLRAFRRAAMKAVPDQTAEIQEIWSAPRKAARK